MTLEDFVLGGQWVFLAYFVGINLGYLAQNVVAAIGIRKYLQTENFHGVLVTNVVAGETRFVEKNDE